MIAALLDINVVLDVFLAGPPGWRTRLPCSPRINEERCRRFVRSVDPHHFLHVRRNADLARAVRRPVGECLDSFDIVPIDRKALELARSMPGADFEDNLQIACAVEARLDAIVTRDPAGFLSSPIPVLTPAQLIAQLREETAGGV